MDTFLYSWYDKKQLKFNPNLSRKTKKTEEIIKFTTEKSLRQDRPSAQSYQTWMLFKLSLSRKGRNILYWSFCSLLQETWQKPLEEDLFWPKLHGGKWCQQELEPDGHIAFTFRKQQGTRASVELPFFFLCCLWLEVTEWCHPCLQFVFPPQLTSSR